MTGRIYKKDLLQSFSKSKGRFFSIFSLMMIGSLALIGLKVTTPNMQRTAQTYIDTTNMMDLAVMGDYGLSDEDVAELNSLKDTTVEFGYLTDQVIKETHDAVRVFSVTKTVSQFQLVSGEMPIDTNQIALSDMMTSRYQLGDTIEFTEKQSDEAEILKSKRFTITGFINSSEIWDKVTIGQTDTGTGELVAYAVTTEEAFNSDVYMMARISYKDLDGIPYYGDAYDEKIAEHQKELDQLISDNGANRLKILKIDIQKKLDSGYLKIAESEKKLTDAADQISEGEKEIQNSQKRLDDAKAQIAVGQSTLALSARDLQEGFNQLSNLQQTLATAKNELDAVKSQLDQTAAQLTQADSELVSGQAQLSTTKLQLEATANQLATAAKNLSETEKQLNQLLETIQLGRFDWEYAKQNLAIQKQALISQGIDPVNLLSIEETENRLQETDRQLSALEMQYDQGYVAYQAGKIDYDNNLKAYQTGRAQYDLGLVEYTHQKASYEEGLAQYNQALTDYQSGLEQYQLGLEQYDQGLLDYQSGQAIYETSFNQLIQSQESLTVNQTKLNEAKTDLETSKGDYQIKQAEAEAEIKKAKNDLAETEKRLLELPEPTYTSYTRHTLPGSSGFITYTSGSESISAVGNLFPLVLYAVAALVTLTTMTRFVDEERHNAGILKSLGYTNRQIIRKFILYGFIASMLGTLVGTVVGNVILSPMIGTILTKSTVIGDSKLYFYPSWILVAIVLSLLSAVLPTYLVAYRDLVHEQPARLLQAKPPVAGSQILLERLNFVWKRMSFTHKVTARNIFRYKQRMFMTIFGVAGSVALLFAGLGIQSSIAGVADTQFKDILTYDMIVVENKQAFDSKKTELSSAIARKEVQSSLAVHYDLIKGVDGKENISLMVTDSELLSQFIKLRNRQSGKQLSMTDEGALISEKLAKLYGVTSGDEITITLVDKPVSIRISGISEMYAGHYLYLTKAYYEQLTDQVYESNSFLIKLKDSSPQVIQSTAAMFLEMPGVAGVMQNTSIEKNLLAISNSLESVMIILIVLSILLAVVILYNLTNINVAERIRELSTIKVLGFHNKEVTLYIYRETIVLSLIGIVVGLVGGFTLHKAMLHMIGTSQIMFQPEVAGYVYAVPILAISGILTTLGWLVNRHLRQIDMLEALKSVD